MTNVFDIGLKRKHILAFITQGGHVSGELMKQIKFRSPTTITKLQEHITNGVEIGDVFVIGYYVFVVIKKHYNSRIKKEQFEIIMNDVAPRISHFSLKTTNDDYEDFKEIIENYLPDIEYCDTGEWGTWKKK